MDSDKMNDKRPSLIRRYSWIAAAVLLAVLIIGSAFAYAYRQKQDKAGSQNFDAATVLPPAPAQQEQEGSAVYTVESLKQFDGKDGHKCYVAVSGTVYEIKDSNYWRNGQHTPSGGRGMCGGDMTEVIKQSPHGTSILSRLSKVGVFK